MEDIFNDKKTRDKKIQEINESLGVQTICDKCYDESLYLPLKKGLNGMYCDDCYELLEEIEEKFVNGELKK